MTTAATTTPIDHTSDAGFRLWVAECVTMWFTTLGLTQTADTGQINTTTVTRPAVNTMAGYVIGRFNDTLQSTAPLFFKIQFGTGNVATSPQIEIQIGTGSNGTGALTGVTSALVSCCGNTSPASPGVVPYLSRACYSAAAGVFWFVGKLNSSGTTNLAQFGFMISRSNDASGAPTADAVMLYANAVGTTGQTSVGAMVGFSTLTGAAIGSPPFAVGAWVFYPFHATTSLFSGNTYVGPMFQATPALGVNNWGCIALVGETAVGATVSLTLVGATAHTYIGIGSPFSLSSMGESSYTSTGGAASSYQLLLLWE